MTGHIQVRCLTKSGNYVSDIDSDAAFIGPHNPKGLFKMVIQPIANSHGQYEIRYMKVSACIVVSGEGYIITGGSKTWIEERCRSRKAERWKPLIQREVSSENDLW